MLISGKGYQGQTNRAPMHFAATSEKWAIAGAELMTLAPSIAYAYENENQRGNIFYPAGNEKTDDWKWKAITIKEWYAEISRILGRCFVYPFEMFGILAVRNMRYIGNEEEALRSGRGPRKTGSMYLRSSTEA